MRLLPKYKVATANRDWGCFVVTLDQPVGAVPYWLRHGLVGPTTDGSLAVATMAMTNWNGTWQLNASFSDFISSSAAMLQTSQHLNYN